MPDPAARVYYWYIEKTRTNKDSKLTSKQDKDSMETKKQTFNKDSFTDITRRLTEVSG